ncbi:MAG: BMP family ABC transporter substrate-binding protein [Anaerolineales bacterium]|nr:BMP family ABC transporter substrate-binding protein [Anaerolineales bacterium]MCB0019401.1 BMP family ABC transporter substrate-binding protein [Anaerolineales bacterium]
MRNRKLWQILLLSVVLALVLAACGGGDEPEPEATEASGATEEEAVDEPATEEVAVEEEMAEEEMPAEPFVFGLIMVGPKDDHGWNEAHWEGAQYVLEHVPGSELVWFDKLNPADNPDITLEQVVDDFVAEGAQFIITNSAEMADATNNAAAAHPDVTFIHASGDAAINGDGPANVGNIMGQMEYGKMMAGCAAAMTTETGSIAYLGPLIDAETRRLVNSAYLGARHCWTENRGMAAEDLSFTVTWIGFWFNIPAVTLDPTQVANDFIDDGADVIISGIDTTEALVVAGQRSASGDNVHAIPYDFIDACAEATDVCLGVPYFNWGPDYLRTVEQIMAGSWSPTWIWSSPDWADINNPDTSAVGWVNGPALSADGQAAVDALIAGLADGSVDLWAGPLNYQDGTEFVAAGASATDDQIWYTQQLLEGVTGASE